MFFKKPFFGISPHASNWPSAGNATEMIKRTTKLETKCFFINKIIILNIHTHCQSGADPWFCYSCLSCCQISRKRLFSSILGYFMSKMTSLVLEFYSGQLGDFFLDPPLLPIVGCFSLGCSYGFESANHLFFYRFTTPQT